MGTNPALSAERGLAHLCADRFFAGFDTRLKTDLVARLPSKVSRVVGFEIDRGRLLVAERDRLLASIEGSKWVALPIRQRPLRVAVDAKGNALFQSPSGILTRGKAALEPLPNR